MIFVIGWCLSGVIDYDTGWMSGCNLQAIDLRGLRRQCVDYIFNVIILSLVCFGYAIGWRMGVL